MKRSGTRRTLLHLAVMLAAVAGLAACGSDSDSTQTSTDANSSSTSSTPAEAVSIKTAEVPDLGKVLVDANGKVVYTLTNNGAAVACAGGCLTAWPPVLLADGTDTATGAADLGVVTITEGKQVTSDGLPLYTFSGDPSAGVANGEGLASFGGTWRVVKVGGTGASSSSTDTTDSTDSSGGYDY